MLIKGVMLMEWKGVVQHLDILQCAHVRVYLRFIFKQGSGCMHLFYMNRLDNYLCKVNIKQATCLWIGLLSMSSRDVMMSC